MNASSRVMLLLALLFIGAQTTVLDAQWEARNGTIMGTVLDSTGKPVPSEIMLYRWSIVNGRANPGAMCSTHTDADGHYECHHLMAGSFVISAHSLAPLLPASPLPTVQNASATAQNASASALKASAPSLSSDASAPSLKTQLPASQESETQEAYPLTFYPDVTDIDSAVKIRLIQNTTETADITVHAVPVHEIRGLLPSRPGIAQISLKAHSGFLNLATPFLASYDAVTGQFLIKSVPEGTYNLIADWATQTGPHHGEALITVSASFDQEIKIEDQALATIQGTLHYAASPSPQMPSSVTLISHDISKKPYTAAVNPDGSFSIPSVIHGEYELTVDHTNGAYVQSITMAGKVVSLQRLAIGGDQTAGTLDVQLDTSTATISGILDAQPAVLGQTGVVVQRVGSNQVFVALADQQRHFSFQDLPPGDYRLYAWDDLDHVEYRNPQFLNAFKNRSTSVTLDEDAPNANVELTAMEADR